MTGRGCPFHCAFCYEGIGHGVRFRSVENVLSEIDAFLKVWTDDELSIYFTDDTFTLSVERVKKICEGIAERRKNIDIKFFCEGHVRTLYKNPEMIRWLAAGGCYRIQPGIESGNDNVLKAYGKNTTTEEILKVVQLCCETGIQQIFGNIILGSAHFSHENFEADKKFVRELLRVGKGVIGLGVVTFRPLPQTETSQFDRLAIAEKQAELETFIYEQMTELLKGRQIPTEKILRWFGNSRRQPSAWFMTLAQLENVHAYYEILYPGEGEESCDVENLSEAHPLRVVSLYKNLTQLDKASILFFDEKVGASVSEVIGVLNRLEKNFLIVYTRN